MAFTGYDPDSVHSPYQEGGSDSDEEDDVDYETDATEVDGDVDPRVQARLGVRVWMVADADRSSEYYIGQQTEMDASENLEEDYATSTTLLLDRCEQQWLQYCRYTGRPSDVAYFHISKGLLHSFFDWRLNQRRGKNGRKLRGTKLCSSLESYWKTFRLVYERATGAKIDPSLTRDTHKSGDKLIMYVDDLVEVLQINLTTLEKRYTLGQQRIDIHIILLLAFPIGQRLEALLNLRYRHLRVTLLRDFEGEPRRVLLEFIFEFTKTFLGIKEAPHVFLLGRLLADRAFAVVELIGLEGLDKLDIRPGCNEPRLDIKDELTDVSILRRSIKTLRGWRISETEPLPYASLYSELKKLGFITGMRQIVRSYTLRYGAGKAFDANGNINDALRNLIMQHADTRTFLRHYFSRHVIADTLAIVRGLESQDALMYAACRMSRSIDPRRPRKLTRAQTLSVNDDPEVRNLLKHRARFKDRLESRVTRNEEYCLLSREITKARQRKRHALLSNVQRRWDKEQAIADIEFQLTGDKFQPELNKIVDATKKKSLKHKRLIQTVMTLPVANIDEERSRRDAAIAAVMTYCEMKEDGPRRDPYSRHHEGPTLLNSSVEKKANAAFPDTQAHEKQQQLEEAMLSMFQKKRPTICFLCLAKKKLALNKRVYHFETAGDLSKHFRRRHLENIRDDDAIECEICNMPLDDKMHLQSHALRIHDTVS